MQFMPDFIHSFPFSSFLFLSLCFPLQAADCGNPRANMDYTVAPGGPKQDKVYAFNMNPVGGKFGNLPGAAN